MSLGFEQAGFNVAAAFDIEEFNTRTHEKNFPETKSFVVDLSKKSGDDLRALAKLKRRKIDVVFGGPPCQGFSFGGRRDLNDKRNLLLYDFARLVRQINPTYFVMENVRGLMSEHCKPMLDSFLRRVKRAGYHIVEPIQVLNAADFGVPQRRLRTIVLGYKRGAKPLEYPEPSGLQISETITINPLVEDAIGDLPFIDDCDELFETDVFDGSLPATDNLYAQLMRGELESPFGEYIIRHVPTAHISGCHRTRHTPETIERFKKTAPGQSEQVSRYIRLAWDDVSPTLRAGTGSDRGSHTAPRPIHPEKARCITTREAARLHSYPDWFRFHGTRWHDFRQIGNSVPPLLGFSIATKIVTILQYFRREVI